MPRTHISDNRILQRGVSIALLVVILTTTIGLTWVGTVSAQEDSEVWLDNPVPGSRVSSEYGWRTLKGKVNFHHGKDFAAAAGTPILSVSNGFVVLSDWWPEASRTNQSTGLGMTVVVYEPTSGLYIYYGHMSRFEFPNVTEAIPVKKGQVIGYIGSTGYSTGPHTHIEIRSTGPNIQNCWSIEGCSFNPDIYLGKAVTGPVDTTNVPQIPQGITDPLTEPLVDEAPLYVPSWEGKEDVVPVPGFAVGESTSNSTANSGVTSFVRNTDTKALTTILLGGLILGAYLALTSKQHRQGAIIGMVVLVLVTLVISQPVNIQATSSQTAMAVPTSLPLEEGEPRQAKPMKVVYHVPTLTAGQAARLRLSVGYPQATTVTGDIGLPDLRVTKCPVYLEFPYSPPAPGGYTALSDFSLQIQLWGPWIEEAASARGLPPRLIAAVMEAESGGRPGAISCSYAVGLMQIMPSDGRYDTLNYTPQMDYRALFAGRPTALQLLKDQKFNIEWGSEYFAGLVEDYWDGRTCDPGSPAGRCYPTVDALRDALRSYYGRGKPATEQYVNGIISRYLTQRGG